MSFLRKVFGFGGCSRLYNNTVDTSIVTIEEDDELIETENILTDVHFIPWSSPGEKMKYFSTKHTNIFQGIGRRLVDKVRDSPRLARRAMTKMTSPSLGRRRHRRQKEEEEAIFVVSVSVVHNSGQQQSTADNNKMDAWSVVQYIYLQENISS